MTFTTTPAVRTAGLLFSIVITGFMLAGIHSLAHTDEASAQAVLHRAMITAQA